MPSSNPPPAGLDVRVYGNDVYSLFGRNVVAKFIEHNALENYPLPLPRPPQPSGIPSESSDAGVAPSSSPGEPRGSQPSRHQGSPIVGILGAGPGGLYTALMLDSIGIPFKIIEGRDRVGGRLYTHNFPNPIGKPYNYFDVGAMRFPDIAAMGRFWDLVRNHGLDIEQKLIRPYLFDDLEENSLLSFNNRTARRGDVTPQTEGVDLNVPSVIFDTPDPQRGAYIGARKAIMDDVVHEFATGLFNDLHNGDNWGPGWNYLMQHDHLSVRAFLSTVYVPSNRVTAEYPDVPHGPADHLPTDIINWYETRTSSTGSYDQGFTDFVLEEIAFGSRPSTDPNTQGGIIPVNISSEVRWYCIDGGAERLAEYLYDHLRVERNHENDFSFKKRVTGIQRVTDGDGGRIEVKIKGERDPLSFTHVISTIPLPVLRTIDLTKAGLTEIQSAALRQLTYGPAIKIGLQFRTAWWTNGDLRDETGQPRPGLNIIGGQTYSDSPLRSVVYPSFGDVHNGMTTTLIASYCWTDDAHRLTGLIAQDDDGLIDLTLRELSRIHNINLQDLRDNLVGSFAWDWSTDIYSMGAYAQFGPGKFRNLYTSLTGLTKCPIYFAGEALSVRHAWVEGALGSAWRAVYSLLLAYYPEKREEFIKKWGMDGEWYTPQREEQYRALGYYYISTEEARNEANNLLLQYLPLTEWMATN